MSDKPNRRKFDLVVRVDLKGAGPDEQLPETTAYAFDANGELLDTAPIKEGRARFQLDTAYRGKTLRVIVGPPTDKEQIPSLRSLRRQQAYERRISLSRQVDDLAIEIFKPDWWKWLLCSCTVRGRIFKRVTLPNGTVVELPITNTLVTICEVDKLWYILPILPDDILFRLRDDILDLIRRPIPIPEPDPGPIFPPNPPGPDPAPFSAALMPRAMTRAINRAVAFENQALSRFQLLDQESKSRVLAVYSASTADDLRIGLSQITDIISPLICWLDILSPYYYDVDCIKSVWVDENGEFETTILYPCFGDKPDLYFKASQWQTSGFVNIYQPSVRCSTYWDYECGTEVNINVTSPAAIPSTPPTPVDPHGIGTWVMPMAVGGTFIWGTGNPDPTLTGWVRPDGLTDYGGITGAPFATTLGFRLVFSQNIPENGLRYYRWAYRKGSSGTWHHMNATVVRHYVKDAPDPSSVTGHHISLPTTPMGPFTVFGKDNLFTFKPDNPPPPDPSDPPGTLTYWPPDEVGDIYHAYLNTASLPPDVLTAAGQYQIRLEVFNAAGVCQSHGGSFSFIVPISNDLVNGIDTRVAQSSEIVSEVTGGETFSGFVFNLHIDNNPCEAELHLVHIGSTAVADECGFLRYELPADLTVSFRAHHPNDFATFGMTVVRGQTPLPAVSASGGVGALSAGLYSGDGDGNFTADIPIEDFLGTCSNAAFAQHLGVYGTATNGHGRLTNFDRGDLQAFALAEAD
ncbi:MAG: hypothetical protein BroJett018_23760 [Chloroflexota bacterium]|nr:hypothetical protein [Chloroflexota bacterium]NOG63322.1 hypothetical protein [Chloroflexota bacterium]GIK64582.1 MAG: hypothetical protein BroJett018_23760 [Chloroflexota bacterium]